MLDVWWTQDGVRVEYVCTFDKNIKKIDYLYQYIYCTFKKIQKIFNDHDLMYRYIMFVQN